MKSLSLPVMVILLAAATAAGADAASERHSGRQVRADLESIQEVPALSTPGRGNFRGTISNDGEELSFELSYEDLQGDVAQAHLHLGQKSVNGGIAIFLCTNLGNGPAGTPACPPAPAEISGTLSAIDVIGPAGQGIDLGEWTEIVQAIRDGVVYVNVHTDLFPGGEIRGQLRVNQRRGKP
ncbi:MAG TPA: CHRD domain-containing protein [Thermoanaerobaculia bacterium]|nr:CHRD domain-containing protein [Thermoanaerobaculia bacterium]